LNLAKKNPTSYRSGEGKSTNYIFPRYLGEFIILPEGITISDALCNQEE